MAENKNAIMYLNRLMKKDTESAKELEIAVNQLKMFDFDSLCHIANIAYSFQLPEDVAFLAVNLAIEQYKHNEKINIQKLFQPLSRNQKQNFAMVYPLYEKATEKYKNKTTEIENESKENEFIIDLPQKIKLEKEERNTKFITANNNDYVVINPMRVPKQAYVLNIYANSFEDYCNLVQSTIRELKNSNITLFLQKPETFQQNIKDKEYAIAYTILVNDNFTFLELDEKIIEKLDEEIIDSVKDERKLAGRVTVKMQLFGALKYLTENGTLTDSSTHFLLPQLDDDSMLQYLEEIGKNENIIKYYIEIMTGISMVAYKQFYKSIIFDTEDMEEILEFVEQHDPFNLDFIVDTNMEDKKFLFIHKEHLRTLIKDMIREGMDIEVNPSIDEFKI